MEIKNLLTTYINGYDNIDNKKYNNLVYQAKKGFGALEKNISDIKEISFFVQKGPVHEVGNDEKKFGIVSQIPVGKQKSNYLVDIAIFISLNQDEIYLVYHFKEKIKDRKDKDTYTVEHFENANPETRLIPTISSMVLVDENGNFNKAKVNNNPASIEIISDDNSNNIRGGLYCSYKRTTTEEEKNTSKHKKIFNGTGFFIRYKDEDKARKIAYNEIIKKIGVIEVKRTSKEASAGSGLLSVKGKSGVYEECLFFKNLQDNSYVWQPGKIELYNGDILVKSYTFTKGIDEYFKTVLRPKIIKNFDFDQNFPIGIKSALISDGNDYKYNGSGNNLYKVKYNKNEINKEFAAGDEIMSMLSSVRVNENLPFDTVSQTVTDVKSYYLINSEFIKDITKKLKNPKEDYSDLYSLFGMTNDNDIVVFKNGSYSNGLTEYGAYAYLYNTTNNFQTRTELIGEISNILSDNKITIEKSEKYIKIKEEDIINANNAINSNKNILKEKKGIIVLVRLDDIANQVLYQFERALRKIYNNNNKKDWFDNSGSFSKLYYDKFLDGMLVLSLFRTTIASSYDMATNIANSMIRNISREDDPQTICSKLYKILYDKASNDKDVIEDILIKEKPDLLKIKLSNYKQKVFEYIKTLEEEIKPDGNIEEIKCNLLKATFTCKARRKLKVISTSAYDGVINKEIGKDITNTRLATIIPSNEPLQNINESNYDKLNISRCEEFIQSWMVKETKNEKVKPTAIPVEGYYDMYSGMTPYVKIGFRMNFCSLNRDEDGNFFDEYGRIKYKLNSSTDGIYTYSELGEDEKSIIREISSGEMAKILLGKFKFIDSINYPYLKSMQIEDTGVKKLDLVLFDPDFGSFNRFKDSEDIFSLESLIRGAIENPYFSDYWEGNSEGYTSEENNNDENGISEKYLKIDRGFDSVSPTNLIIRFGYADDNLTPKKTKDGSSVSEQSFLDRFGSDEKDNKRDYRWWDVSILPDGDTGKIEEIKKYIDRGEIKGIGGSYNKIADTGIKQISNGTQNSIKTKMTLKDFYNSSFQTTSVSRQYEFMIIGFETEFTESGIEYRIKAIESKDAAVLKTRFLQRNSELTANPEEALYMLMHCFNEDNDGNNIIDSNVKICIVEDSDDDIMKDMINMCYDYKKMNPDLLDGTEDDDLYSMVCSGTGLKFDENYLKEITLNFGSDEATVNYNRNSRTQNKPPLYKSVAQLMDEFCAKCPPKIRKNKNISKTDENGNEIISDGKNYQARPLKWFTFKDDNNNIIYLCLYYRTTKKLNKIRVYTWGPNNPSNSCVKRVNIKNANEFAVLSGVKAFDSSSIISRDSSMISGGKISYKNKDILENRNFNLVGKNAQAYLNAYSSCMYNLTMEVIGDPSLAFDGNVQPFTYPVEVDLMMPQNEFTRNSLAKGDDKVINAIEKNMPRFINNYKGTGWYQRNKNQEGSQGTGTLETGNPIEIATTTNQTLHEASGYYVISKIIHNINSSGYSTTLELASYPNIQNDIGF